jgi:predicted PurR-regulated permease PerM
MDKPERKETAQRALVWIGIALAVVVLLVLIWYGLDVFLLAFLGVLLAILLRAPADWLTRTTGIGTGWTLAFVCLVLLAALSIGGFLFGQQVAEQSVGLSARIPEIVESTRSRLENSEIGRSVLQLVELSGGSGGELQFLGRGLGLLGSTFGILANIAIVIFFAVFLAAQPKLYIDGLVHLVAHSRRARVREVLHEAGDVLRRWVVAQSLLALVIAILVGSGLLLLGAPFALPLALLAGLMEFVPYIGPLLAAVPAVLVGLAEGPSMVLWIAGLYLIVQAIESYVLSPIVQHKAVYLAPALILFAQVLLGVVAGGLGVAVATPLAAALMVVVNKLYVEDVLGERQSRQASSRST